MKIKVITAILLINSGMFIGANEQKTTDKLTDVYVYRFDSTGKGILIYKEKSNYRFYIEEDKISDQKAEFSSDIPNCTLVPSHISKEGQDVFENNKELFKSIPGQFGILTSFESNKTSFSIPDNRWLNHMTINTANLTEKQKIDLTLKMQKCINPDWSLLDTIFGYENPDKCIEKLATITNKQVDSEIK
jgi:hypothetical protein